MGSHAYNNEIITKGINVCVPSEASAEKATCKVRQARSKVRKKAISKERGFMRSLLAI